MVNKLNINKFWKSWTKVRKLRNSKSKSVYMIFQMENFASIILSKKCYPASRISNYRQKIICIEYRWMNAMNIWYDNGVSSSAMFHIFAAFECKLGWCYQIFGSVDFLHKQCNMLKRKPVAAPLSLYSAISSNAVAEVTISLDF